MNWTTSSLWWPQCSERAGRRGGNSETSWQTVLGPLLAAAKGTRASARPSPQPPSANGSGARRARAKGAPRLCRERHGRVGKVGGELVQIDQPLGLQGCVGASLELLEADASLGVVVVKSLGRALAVGVRRAWTVALASAASTGRLGWSAPPGSHRQLVRLRRCSRRLRLGRRGAYDWLGRLGWRLVRHDELALVRSRCAGREAPGGMPGRRGSARTTSPA